MLQLEALVEMVMRPVTSVVRMAITLLTAVLVLTTLQHARSSAEPRVYVGVKRPDPNSVSPGQRELLNQIVREIVAELRSNRDAVVDTEEWRDTWSAHEDWKSLAEEGKTHYLMAIPETVYESELGKVLKVYWQVGSIATVEGQQVPVFAGELSEAFDTVISKEKTDEGKAAATQKYFGEQLKWQPQPLRISVVLPVISTVRQIFPELGQASSYYISCFTIDQQPPPKIWAERKKQLLSKLISQVLHRKLRYVKSMEDPGDEARSVCDGVPDRTIVGSADYYVHGAASQAPQPRQLIRVQIENRASKRRLSDEFARPPRNISSDFNRQLRLWSTQYEGQSSWQLTLCANKPDFWGAPNKFQNLSDNLAKYIQAKLLADESFSLDVKWQCR
jgi:hypothetical protein